MAIKKVENGNWMYDIRHPITKRRHRIRGFRTKGEATEARDNQVQRWKAEKFGLEAPQVRSRLLVRDAFLAESKLLKTETDSTYRTTRKQLVAAWAKRMAEYYPANLKVTDLTASHLNKFIDAELARGIKPSSVNSRMTNFKYVLRRIREHNKAELAHWEIPEHKSIPGFSSRASSNRKLRRVWTDEELSKVLHVLRNPDKYSTSQRKADIRKTWRDVADFLEIAALTGMRKTEILLLRWDRIFFDWNVMQARTLKRKAGAEEYRDIPLTGELATLLRSRRELLHSTRGEGDSPLVFPRWETGHYQAVWIYNTLREVCRIAGVPYGQKAGVVPHGLRHTAATKMVTRGVDLGTAADVLGNKVETMLANYSHTTLASKTAAMESLRPTTAANDKDNVVPLRRSGEKAA